MPGFELIGLKEKKALIKLIDDGGILFAHGFDSLRKNYHVREFEKLISKKEAILRIDANTLDTLLHPTLDEKVEKKVIAKGLPASPGAASGKVVFTADEAERMSNQKEDTILVRLETSPEDIHGMHAAKGILTARGGMTSHAAVVARGMGRPCVSGSSEIYIDYESKEF